MSAVVDLIRSHETVFGLVVLVGLFAFVLGCAMNEEAQS